MTTVAVTTPRLIDLFSLHTVIEEKQPRAAATTAWKTTSVARTNIYQKTAADLTDEDVLAAICRKEEQAIELLFERYHRHAYALAYRVVQDPNIAEDVVQEAFLAVWKKAASYHMQSGSVHGWLQAIVHHKAIDKVREARHRSQQWVPLQTENEQDPPGEHPDVWEEAWQAEQQQLIRAALAHIPQEQRLVIELAYFQGLTHAEIAEQCRIPLGTVKGRMRLGLQKMRAYLQERGITTP